MLSELNGAGPVLLALTGNDLGRARKKGNIFTRTFKKVAKYSPAALVTKYSPAALTIRAGIATAKAAKAAAERARKKNIEKAKIEKANRARKLAEARKQQAQAEAEAKQAQAANAAIPEYTPSYSPEPQYESPMEEVNETADAPADETEEIQDTSEEGAEENVETMGYSRSNDDYFVGSPLKRSVAKLKTSAVKSGQLKLVKKVETPNKKLLIIGGLALGAFLFRKQLSRAFK